MELENLNRFTSIGYVVCSQNCLFYVVRSLKTVQTHTRDTAFSHEMSDVFICAALEQFI